MEILKIAGLALTGVLLASLMKSVHKEFSIYIILATVIVVFLMILDKLTEVFVFLQSIYDSVPYGKTFFPVIFKVLAVAYIADLTAQLCRDAGESAVGGKVELAGKVIIFSTWRCRFCRRYWNRSGLFCSSRLKITKGGWHGLRNRVGRTT